MGTSNCVSFRVTPRNSCGSVKIKRFLERKSSLVSGFALPLGLSFNFSLLLPQGWWPSADGCLIKGWKAKIHDRSVFSVCFDRKNSHNRTFYRAKRATRRILSLLKAGKGWKSALCCLYHINVIKNYLIQYITKSWCHPQSPQWHCWGLGPILTHRPGLHWSVCKCKSPAQRWNAGTWCLQSKK